MDVIIILLLIVGVFIFAGKGLTAARAKNSIVSWATGQEGFCADCTHCRKDASRKFSNTDYFCSLSRREDITDETRMQCFEKPKMTEQVLQEIFALGIWTKEGQQYIRQSILGRKMTFAELDQFMTKIPNEHPEYIA